MKISTRQQCTFYAGREKPHNFSRLPKRLLRNPRRFVKTLDTPGISMIQEYPISCAQPTRWLPQRLSPQRESLSRTVCT